MGDKQAVQQTTIDERVARAICAADGVDPDLEIVGVGCVMPAGWRGSAWEVRLPQARAAIVAALRALGDAPDADWMLDPPRWREAYRVTADQFAGEAVCHE